MPQIPPQTPRKVLRPLVFERLEAYEPGEVESGCNAFEVERRFGAENLQIMAPLAIKILENGIAPALNY